MNRLIFTMGLMMVLIVPQAWSAGTQYQYPNPYRQTIWNNITDGVHTFGQDPQETKNTLKRLHNARINARLNSISQATMAKFKARRQAWIRSQNN